jgi:hypothetical protein
MKTDAFIEFLAKGSRAEPALALSHKLFWALSVAGLFSLALALTIIGPLPAKTFMTPTPWIKFAYTVSLAVAATFLTIRLARPVADRRAPSVWLALVLLAMLAFGAWHLALTPEQAKQQALFGQTSLLCPWLVLLVSLPGLFALQLAIRAFGPVHLSQAGFACGLLAGAIGATAYAMACPEDSPTFLAVWYTLGIVLTSAVGAISGRWLLRWS